LINSGQEKKDAILELNSGAQLQIITTSAGTGPAIQNIIPNIPQGVSDGNRLGNEVRVKKAYLNIAISRRAVNAQDSPVYMCIYIGRLYNSMDTPADADFNMLYRATGSTTTGLYTAAAAAVNTMLSDINTDDWKIYFKKIVKMGNSNYLANNTTAASEAYSNNDFKNTFVKRINITKMLHKRWKFNNSVNDFPENDGLFLFVVPVTVDASTPTGPNYTLTATSVVRYTDA